MDGSLRLSSAGNYTVTSLGNYSVTLKMWGGGGGSGYATSPLTGGSPGGGAGYTGGTWTLINGESYNLCVASGGGAAMAGGN